MEGARPVDGFLDEFDRAFLTVDFGQGPLDFLIDTGFFGTLLIGAEVFDSTKGVAAGPVEAALAADQRSILESFDLQFEWFGHPIEAQILVGPGKECLLGTVLLAPHRLEIDYEARTVRLVRASSW